MPDLPYLDAIVTRSLNLWEHALSTWIAGGWAMIAIALSALVMFGMGVHVYLRLRATRFHAVRERTWRRWISHPEERRGPVGDLLNAVAGGDSLTDTATFFQGIRTTELAPFERDLRVMRICVAIAPLLGLLGTVTGMLTTFSALASGSGGEKTMAQIASGISEALITTETGLVVALPGLFLQYQLARRFDQYKAFLAHVESVCTQLQFRTQRSRDKAHPAHGAARPSDEVAVASA